MTAPQTKADYFDISKSLSLPARCPLLASCERRAHTIALANEWPLDIASKRLGMKVPLIKSIGESAYRIGGNNNFVMGGLCPEVSLFDGAAAFIGFSESPTTKVDYDAHFPDEKFRILETGHYSQCAEYSAQSATAQIGVNNKSWFALNYQWLIGTVIAFGATVAAFLALK